MRATKPSHLRHYLVVAAGIAICAGPSALAFSCAGIFFTPVSTALGVGKGTFAIYMTVLCLMMFFTLPVAGNIIAKRDVRIVLSTAVILVGAPMFAMGFFDAVWHFYIAGAVMGFGEAFLLYLAIPTLINRWFKHKVGFFLGLCMAFTGVGGVVFNLLGDYLINTHGWRMAYHAFGILALLIALPFTIFAIGNSPAEKGLRPFGDDGSADTDTGATLRGVAASTAFRSSAFYALAGFAGLVGFNSII